MLMVCHHLDKNIAGGRRVRRKPDSRRDDRRRRRAARSRRHQHDVERQPGDGPRRRSHLPHVADGRQDAARSAAGCPASRATTTTCASGATSRSTRSIRRSRTACRTKSDRSKPASSRISCCGGRSSSASSRRWCIKGGFIAWAQMGDANASIPTPQPVLMRPMFGAFGRATEAISLAFVSQASLDAGIASRYRVGEAAGRRPRLPHARQARHEAERRAAGHHRRSGNLRRDGGWRGACARSLRPCCRSRSDTSCSR